MEEYFTDTDVIRRVDREPLLLLGGWRALLMQLAHPGVAAGVAEHSRFTDDPLARLRHSLAAPAMVVFGSVDQARRTADAVRSVHARVEGRGYRASDPELMLWVHATLVDTALCVHNRFYRVLPSEEAERYYQQSTVVAEVLGVPRQLQPPDLDGFRGYVETMIGSLRVSETARRLAHQVLHPRVWPLLEPGLVVARQLTAGLLPTGLRDQYGLSWSCPHHAAFLLASLTSRLVLPRVPAPLRRAPALLLV